MVRAIGMSARGSGLSIYGLEDGKPYMRAFYPFSKIDEHSEEIISLVRDADAVVAPSGYGLPVRRLMDCDDEDFSYLYLMKKGDESLPSIREIERLVRKMAEECPNSFVIPSVIELDSVPEHRKVNLIDMGNSDALCSAVLAVKFQTDSLGIDYEESSFLLIDLGYESNSFLIVEDGKIIDGIGGSNCRMGFLGMGRMDSQLAYLLGGFDKATVLKGGLADFTGCEEFDKAIKGPRSTAYLEGIVKDAGSMLATFKPREILLSGELVSSEVIEELKRLGIGVRKVKGFSEFKLVVQGAAIIADGIAGGEFEELVRHIGVFDASGTAIDHLYPNWISDAVKKALLS